MRVKTALRGVGRPRGNLRRRSAELMLSPMRKCELMAMVLLSGSIFGPVLGCDEQPVLTRPIEVSASSSVSAQASATQPSAMQPSAMAAMQPSAMSASAMSASTMSASAMSASAMSASAMSASAMQPTQQLANAIQPTTQLRRQPTGENLRRGTAPLGAPNSFPGTERTHTEILDALTNTPTRGYRPVGTSSITFEVKLGAMRGAFRPASRSHPRGHTAEIAAYRIARYLQMDNVPPVVARSVRIRRVRRQLTRSPPGWERRVIREGNELPGAMIYWIEGMEDLDLEDRDDWQPWLVQGTEVPEEKRAMARDISNMLVLDFLIGNFDRFSGRNTARTRDGSRAFVRDHNQAFRPLNARLLDRMLNRLMLAERFSERTVSRLRRLNPQSLDHALSEEPTHQARPVLNEREMREVLDRAATVRTYIDALLEEHGRSAVLTFP